MDPTISEMNETALVVRFGSRIDEQTHERVMRFARSLAAEPPAGVVECVPAYATVTVFYDPLAVLAARTADRKRVARADDPLDPFRSLCRALHPLVDRAIGDHETARETRSIEVPVCYGGEHGADLLFVAEHAGCTPGEVIELHAAGDYRVHLIGFAPGFPYLGGLDPRLHAPRLASPRSRVPAGSVAIGGAQTGIYSMDSPGGWRLIGRTPLRLFRPESDAPSLLRAGDRVRFRPVTPREFDLLLADPPA